jgi:hypothetical protein
VLGGGLMGGCVWMRSEGREIKNRRDPQIEEANTCSHCSKLQFRGLNFIGNPPNTLLFYRELKTAWQLLT